MTDTESMLDELRTITAEREKLDQRHSFLVQQLMTADVKVARDRIALAAGLSVPRLYQIRDGRR